MKNLVLVAAAVTALWTGAAYAQDNVAKQPAQTTEYSAQGLAYATTYSAQRLAYATTTRGQVSIYPNFRNDGYSQGGEQ